MNRSSFCHPRCGLGRSSRRAGSWAPFVVVVSGVVEPASEQRFTWVLLSPPIATQRWDVSSSVSWHLANQRKWLFGGLHVQAALASQRRYSRRARRFLHAWRHCAGNELQCQKCGDTHGRPLRDRGRPGILSERELLTCKRGSGDEVNYPTRGSAPVSATISYGPGPPPLVAL